MDTKSLGYEFTGIPCVELIAIQQTQGVDGPYIEIVMQLRAFDALLSFNAGDFDIFVDNLIKVRATAQMMNAELRHAESAERENGRA